MCVYIYVYVCMYVCVYIYVCFLVQRDGDRNMPRATVAAYRPKMEGHQEHASESTHVFDPAIHCVLFCTETPEDAQCKNTREADLERTRVQIL